jgi:predicted nucleotidyltransferase
MQRDEVLRALREHAAELTSLHVTSLSLFGSIARGDAGPGSDVDLLVEFDRTIGLFHFVRVKTRLEEILGAEVDLVMRTALRPEFRDSVLSEAIRAA